MTETILIEAETCILKWLQLVAEQGKEYKNSDVEIFEKVGKGHSAEETDMGEGTGEGMGEEAEPW
jgi:hypothetical protein